MGRQPLIRRLVELGFHLLYHRLAWSYDAVSWVVSLGDWAAWQQAALPYVRGPRVLELAHGTGRLLPLLAARFPHVIGIDRSPQMGRIARRRLARAGLTLPILRADAAALPLADGCVECVATTFPTGFILQPQTLREIGRVLTPGGRLVIVPAAWFTGDGPAVRLLTALYALTGQSSGAAPPIGWQQLWQEQLAAAGFVATFHTVALPSSAAQVITADRPLESAAFGAIVPVQH